MTNNRIRKDLQTNMLKVFNVGDPDENRTRDTAVKGRCLNRLTTGPATGSGNWI